MAVCGIDLGGTKCLGVVLDGEQIVAEHRVPTPRTPAELVAVLAGVVESVRQSLGSSHGGSRSVDAVGVGAPGLVDRAGVLRVAPNLAAGEGLAIADELSALVGLPVAVDNDATCAAWGETRQGAARGHSNVIMVTLGTGIGGGIVSGGRMARGANGFSGEIGHMVVDPRGPLCPCGRRGCWERFASGSGLGRLAREAAHAGAASRVLELAGGDAEDVRGEHVTTAVAEGDAEAIEVLGAFAWWVGMGLANLGNIFDPDVFVIGGGLVRAGEALLGPTREAFVGMLQGASRRPEIAILPAALGERSGAVGAAWLAADRAQ